MIKKSNLIVLCISSIILVLIVYYYLIPENSTNLVAKTINDAKEVSINEVESESITAMRVNKEEEDLQELETLKEVMLASDKDANAKNEAYEKIQSINNEKALEEKLEKLLKTDLHLSSFIDIKSDKVKVVISNKEDNYALANNIITKINDYVDYKYYVTVKFE